MVLGKLDLVVFPKYHYQSFQVLQILDDGIDEVFWQV